MPLNYIINFEIIFTCAVFFNKGWRLWKFNSNNRDESQGQGQEKLQDVQLDSL